MHPSTHPFFHSSLLPSLTSSSCDSNRLPWAAASHTIPLHHTHTSTYRQMYTYPPCTLLPLMSMIQCAMILACVRSLHDRCIHLYHHYQPRITHPCDHHHACYWHHCHVD